MDDWRARTPPGALTGRQGLAARAPHDAPRPRAGDRRLRPDAVLVDAAAWGALGAAEAWGGPWGGDLPLPAAAVFALRPADGARAAPGPRAARAAAGPHRRGRSRPALDRISVAGLNPLRAARAAAARPRRRRAPAPPLLLYTSAEPFEYRRPDWPASVVMVGPCAWEPPGGCRRELERVEAPLVLVTASTEFQDDGRLAETAFEALAEEPVHVVATVPGRRPAAEAAGQRAPSLGFAPHGPILARAACAVTHGGMGATQKALATASQSARCRSAATSTRSRAGRGQPARDPAAGAAAKPARLRQAVREAMRCAEGAQRVAAGFAAAGGPAAAADAVEQRLLRA